MKTLTLEELHERLENLDDNDIILDVRRPEEYAEGHIPGSMNISHESVLDHAEDLKKYDNIFIHCKMGGRAQRAFMDLESAGLDNIYCVTEAGIEEWMARGYPINHP